MALKAGDLVVTLSDMTIDVFADRPVAQFSAEPPAFQMMPRDIAMVVSLDRLDGRCVYVVAPGGVGWTFGAFLRRIRI